MFAFFMLVFMFSVPALILGMIAPRVYGRFFKNGVTRGKIAKALGTVMLGSFIIGIATAPPVEEKSTKAVTETEASTETNQDTAVAEQETGTEAQPAITSKVIKVVDGDTVTVETNGVRETIRIIGINTPETVDPRKPVECFGQEASARAHELLDNQTVTLEADATQGERDKYDRLLRYVFLSNGSDFGKQMISEGYAYEYTYSTPYKYQQDYKTSQSDAESAKRGLWANGACSDAAGDSGTPQEATVTTDTSSQSSNTAPTTDSEQTTATTTITPVIPESASPTTNASCSCSANIYNCGDFTTHAEAQAVHDCCVAQVGYDIHKLDGTDNDGLACESLP